MVKTATKLIGLSKVRGLDNISYARLNHVGSMALSALTGIFNLSLKNNAIPIIWKIETTIPILNQTKTPE